MLNNKMNKQRLISFGNFWCSRSTWLFRADQIKKARIVSKIKFHKKSPKTQKQLNSTQKIFSISQSPSLKAELYQEVYVVK